MSLFSKIETMHDLLCYELSDMYSAEKQLIEALPKMAKAASNPQLKQAFEMHLEETKGQKEKLERVFEMLDEKPKHETCDAMKGLVKEGNEAVSEIKEGPVLDAALIIAAQKVEHYEIAAYGALRDLLKQEGKAQAATLIEEILEQEKAADTKLNSLALGRVNKMASAA